jgi:hypothetical protein
VIHGSHTHGACALQGKRTTEETEETVQKDQLRIQAVRDQRLAMCEVLHTRVNAENVEIAYRSEKLLVRL